MKQKMDRKKAGIAAAAAIAAMAAVIIIAVMCRNGKETYRSIKIVELAGGVGIDRDGVGRLDAAENMNLVSGDYVTTDKDAYVVLRLDTDKYVMLGEAGAMKVVAEGSGNSTKTAIHLEQGSVLNEIQNPLSQGSSYEIVTPSATMSVRGTVFEVQKEDGGDGHISVLVYDGSVAVGLDGKEPVVYKAGEYTVFTGGASPEVIVERGTVSEEVLDGKVRERLQQMESQGRSLNVGSADLSRETPAETLQGTAAPAPASTPEATATPESTATPEITAAPVSTPEATAVPVSTPEAAPAPVSTPKVTAAPAPEQAPEETETPVEEPEEDEEEEPAPVEEPTPVPTIEPTAEPTIAPTIEPTVAPTAAPTAEPTIAPTVAPTAAPTAEPTIAPTAEPTIEPTVAPTAAPTAEPTIAPTAAPTPVPTVEPTPAPTETPDGKETYRLTYMIPYIITSYQEDEAGGLVAEMNEAEPVIYSSGDVKKGGWVFPVNAPSCYSAPNKGGFGEEELTFAGWQTEDGKAWLPWNTVSEDVVLYATWRDSKGNLYKTVIYEDQESGLRICNSVREGARLVRKFKAAEEAVN